MQNELNELLTKAKELLKDEMTKISYETWIKNLEIQSFDNDIVVLVASSGFQKESIQSRYYDLLTNTFNFITNKECQINIISKDELQEEEAINLPNDVGYGYSNSTLNPKYTFDTFVVGNNNRFAHAAALAVAEAPATSYNPLFIYGGVGLGKTHLMHSVAHYILQKDPTKKVLYVTSEVFTNELIDSIRNGNNNSMTAFREKYRNIDVLLIDDVQFIIGKESTQEEFFHTFNALHSANKQIIISSDRPPKDMETLEARLQSRFEWGLIADISSPDYETRMAILRKKEELDGYNIDDEVIRYIATNIKFNIRELEGALNKLVALSNLEKREINISMAEEVLKDIISPNQKREVTPQVILEVVAEHYGISVSDIIGGKRNAEIVTPRQVVMYLCREITDTPYKAIGILLGNRDHSTIINGDGKVRKQLQANDGSLKNNIDIIRKKLSS